MRSLKRMTTLSLGSMVSSTVIGSTWTLPTAPASLSAVGTSPTSIDVIWLKNNNSSSATYEVTYTTDNFVTNVATAIAFSAKYGGSVSSLTLTVPASITGLVTGSTYSVRVVASNPFGQLSQFSNIITTRTSNGGGVLGSLTGPILAASNAALVGSIGNGRQVTLRVPAHTFPGDVTIAISSWSIADHGGDLDCTGGLTDIGFEITDSPSFQPSGSLFLSFLLCG